MLSYRKYIFSPFQVNTYLIYDKQTGYAAVIDPGCSNDGERDFLLKEIEKLNLNLQLIINTHLHIDHIFGNNFLKKEFGAKLIYPQGDEFLLPIMYEEAEKFGVRLEETPEADVYFENIDKIKLGETVLEPLFTPGHTPAEYCLYCEQDSLCFTGDVLFRESIGRTDLWEGDYDLLIESIYSKLFALPEDTIVLPGHGEQTTIGYEREYNPFL